MVYDIGMQKIVFSIPSATNIKALERKQSNNQKKSFNKHLEEKAGENKKKKDRQSSQQTEITSVKESKQDRWVISIEQQGSQKMNKVEEKEKINLIDILV